jgi:hypothetical protein
MVLSTTKRCQNIQSITNNICNLGGDKKSGLVNMQGRNPNLGGAITTRAPYCNCGMPLGCIAGLAYLKANNLMTMNPQCSGGVPHRMYRGCNSSAGDPGAGPSSYAVTGTSGSGAGTSGTGAGTSGSGGNVVLRLSDITTPISFQNWGNVLMNAFTIQAGQILTISASEMFRVPPSIQLTNKGTIINNGHIYMDGIIENNGGGTFTNNNNIKVIDGGIFNNRNGGGINNNGILEIVHGAAFNNYGTIYNNADGFISVTEIDDIFNNTGTIYNGGIIENPRGGIFQGSAPIGNPIIISAAAAASTTALANANANPSNKIQFSDIVDVVNGNLKTSTTIPHGKFLIISSSEALTINNLTLTNYGTILIVGSVYITGTSANLVNYGTVALLAVDTSTNGNLQVINGGILINRLGGTISNYGDIDIGYNSPSSTGTFQNYGIFYNYFDGGIGINNLGSTFVNQNSIVNYGDAANSGTFQNSGSIKYTLFSVYSNIDETSAAQAASNAEVATALTGATPSNTIGLSSFAQLNSYGEYDMKESYTIQAGKFLTISSSNLNIINNFTLTNYGTIIIVGNIWIDGTSVKLVNYGTIIITYQGSIHIVMRATGTIDNKVGGTIVIYNYILMYAGTTLTNQGTIANYGHIINFGGTIQGTGSIGPIPVNK